MSSSEPDTITVEKHYRMTLDFRVLVGDVSKDGVERDGDDAEGAREHLERQRRLLCALLRDERVLDEFMTYLVTDRVCSHPDSELDKVFGVKSEEEMLEPVFSALGEDDAQFFREVRQDGILWENTEQFECCFAVDWTGATLIEIAGKKEGDPTASEAGQTYLRRFTHRGDKK
ncbi:MAG: hypothetical protein LC803_22150 [Acidobacteria bacterium]|nr:hypothetical protein [Acidobacteriota bacterium]